LVEQGFKGSYVAVSRNGIYKDKSFSKSQEKLRGTLIFLSFIDKGEGLNIYDYLG
jgi:hypothetical protein